jgi:hypothetical protein
MSTFVAFTVPNGYTGNPLIDSSNRSIDIMKSSIAGNTLTVELKNFTVNPQSTDLSVTWLK